jgi:quinoprotein glucose dehydrogenase
MARRSEQGWQKKGASFWWTMLVAAVLVIFGLPIAAGGAWLIALGGSWYYLPAGLGLLATAYFLFRRDAMAVWVYLTTFVVGGGARWLGTSSTSDCADCRFIADPVGLASFAQ